MNSGNYAVEIKNLTVRFGSFTAVDDVSFSVKKGEIFGFLGANGAGKTTTIRVICGLLSPSSGTLTISGKTFDQIDNTIKEKVGYMSQKFTLYDDLTVSENMYFKASLRRLERSYTNKRISELFNFIGFTYPEDTLVRDLPTGVKQQVSLAATLIHDPDIVFLDEPTAGVSPKVRELFWQLIKKLSTENKTVIVTTHYMDEAEHCQRIALMRSGKLIALDNPEGLKASTYPEPLVQLSGINSVDKSFIDNLAKSEFVLNIWPYGMRYHVLLKSETALNSFKNILPEGFSLERIAPSLEDVFIRLVEGTDR